MQKKTSSILDYKQPNLSPAIWVDGNIKYEVKEFILDSIIDFFDDVDMMDLSTCIESIYIGSSLATYYYTPTSDLDVKVILDCVDLDYTGNIDELMEHLVKLGRESADLTRMIPGTYHPLDVYFYSTNEFYPITLIKYDSLYDVIAGEWLKEPEEPLKGLSPSIILEKAKQKANPYLKKVTLDIAKAKRDIIDFCIIRDFLKTLDGDDLSTIKDEFTRIVETLTDSIEQLIEDKTLIKSLRKKSFNKKELTTDLEYLLGSLNYSDGNLIFKVLQRYGYMRILAEVEDIYEKKGLTSKSVKEIQDTLND